MPIKVVPLRVWLTGVSAWCIGGLSDRIHLSSGLSHFWSRTQHFTLQDPAELGLIMVLLAEHWLPGAIGVRVMEGETMAWELSGDCHYPAEGKAGGGQGSEEGDIKGWESSPQWLWGQAESDCPGCPSCKHSTTFPIPPFPFQLVVDHPLPPSWGRGSLPGRGCFILVACGDSQFKMRMLQHLLGWLGPSTPWQDCGEKGKAKRPELVVGRSCGESAAALVVAVDVSWNRRSLASPQEGVRGSQKGNEEQLLPQKWPQALGRSRAAGTKGAECGGMAGGSQETPRSDMNLFLGTVLLLLLLPDVAEGWNSCSDVDRGDEHHECCNMTVKQQNPGNSTRNLRWRQHCLELWHSKSRACACLREQWFRLLHLGWHQLLPGLKTLLLNVSRAVTRDVHISFSPTAGSSRPNTTGKGKAGKIHLPREIFRSLASQTVPVVVTVLNIQQFGMFKEANQTGQVLDNTVVGITVGESSISGLQDPVQLMFTHGELPQSVTPQCVFWDPSKGQAGGWSSSGCDTQPGENGTVCSCDHLTFFTLLLNQALDGSTAKALMAVATVGCGVAVAFSIFTMAFCIFIRCRFMFEETVRINLGLHMNLVGSLFLLNLAFLLNSGLSGRTHPSTCRVLGGLTHYCLLCCFTWTALEGCQLYLLFVKVLGIYIPHYLGKLCLVGWGFPVLVVGVAGGIGSYGEYSIRTTDHGVIGHLCVCHCPQDSAAGSLPNIFWSTTSPTVATLASSSSSTWLSLGW
ncbi:adhesion G protein-coupled receptor G3 isoform 2-T2 [Sylvia borin]